MYRANAAFLSACQEQGVTIYPELRDCLTGPNDSMVYEIELFHEEQGSGAGSALELTDQLLQIDAMPDDPLLRMLGTLCNLGHKVADPRPSAYQAADSVKEAYATCSVVERNWSESVAAAKKQPPGNPRVEVFVDEAHQPVMMRKGRGSYPTGVLLEAVRAQNNHVELVYPPGSIVLIETGQDIARIVKRSDGTRKLWLPGQDSLVTPLDEVTGVSYARLSPIACDNRLDRREQFPVYNPSLDLSRPLEQLRGLAHKVIRLNQQGDFS